MKKLSALLLCFALCLGCISSQADILMPQDLIVIEDEAFQGNTSLEQVVLDNSIRSIGARAFAGSSIKSIEVPDTIESIADDAFDGCDSEMTIIGSVGSYAESYAASHGIRFQSNAGDDPAEVLVLATNIAFPPFEYYDDNGQAVGIDLEIAEAVARRMGAKLEIHDLSFSCVLSAVLAGDADFAMAGLIATSQRLEILDFSDTYYINDSVILCTKDSGFSSFVQLIEPAKDLTVFVLPNTTGSIYYESDVGWSEHPERVNIIQAESLDEITTAFASGRADAAVLYRTQAEAVMNGNTVLTTQMKIIPFSVEYYAAAFSKGATLCAAFNTALSELQSEGVIQQIVDKYIVTK